MCTIDFIEYIIPEGNIMGEISKNFTDIELSAVLFAYLES